MPPPPSAPRQNDFTPLSDPEWMSPYDVEGYVGALMQSNNPPMPTYVRLARAVRHAYEMGHHEGARAQRAIQSQRKRRATAPRRPND